MSARGMLQNRGEMRRRGGGREARQAGGHDAAAPPVEVSRQRQRSGRRLAAREVSRRGGRCAARPRGTEWWRDAAARHRAVAACAIARRASALDPRHTSARVRTVRTER
eukprot:3324079-Prymnesium_polylepis.1